MQTTGAISIATAQHVRRAGIVKEDFVRNNYQQARGDEINTPVSLPFPTAASRTFNSSLSLLIYR
jgi:hypothetical protein